MKHLKPVEILTKESIDKIETLIGYLEYFNEAVTPEVQPSELSDVIKEAKEWIEELKS
jgi:hypothetical protein